MFTSNLFTLRSNVGLAEILIGATTTSVQDFLNVETFMRMERYFSLHVRKILVNTGQTRVRINTTTKNTVDKSKT